MPDLNLSNTTLTDRLQTLNDPYAAGSHRLVIWASSWEMIKTTPWLGIGAGMFWLVYPQYRSPLDSSGGFYAHNDYLQIWIENGLPALLLLCASLIITLIYFIKLIRTEISPERRIELTGIFSGLFAISLHSLFTFNFYILSILVLSGIFLARFNQLCTNDATRFITLHIKNNTRLFLVLISIVYVFISHSLYSEWRSDSYREQALSFAIQNNYVEADQMLTQAIKQQPSEAIYLNRASLLIRLLQQTPASAVDSKQVLFDTALRSIEKAAALNPYRSYRHLLKGRLYAENPTFAQDTYKQAEVAFKQSLQLNPRQFRAHYALALLYAKKGLLLEAATLLNEGIGNKPLLTGIYNKLPYWQLALRVNHSLGNMDQVNKIAKMIKTTLPERETDYLLDEIIENIVNSNTSDYNFNEYDDSAEPRLKI